MWRSAQHFWNTVTVSPFPECASQNRGICIWKCKASVSLQVPNKPLWKRVSSSIFLEMQNINIYLAKLCPLFISQGQPKHWKPPLTPVQVCIHYWYQDWEVAINFSILGYPQQCIQLQISTYISYCYTEPFKLRSRFGPKHQCIFITVFLLFLSHYFPSYSDLVS